MLKMFRTPLIVLAGVLLIGFCIYLIQDAKTVGGEVLSAYSALDNAHEVAKKADFRQQYEVVYINPPQGVDGQQQQQTPTANADGNYFKGTEEFNTIFNSDSKKEVANQIWKLFYVDGGYSAEFTCGLIGNSLGEGVFGQFEYSGGYEPYNQRYNVNPPIESGDICETLQQAEVFCLKITDINRGIGFIQWTSAGRKAGLYECYKKYAVDGKLPESSLIQAELEWIKKELSPGTSYYNSVVKWYADNVENNSTFSAEDKVTASTCLIFRRYEIPRYYHVVSSSNPITYDKSGTGEAYESIKLRCRAAQAAYEAFMGGN